MIRRAPIVALLIVGWLAGSWPSAVSCETNDRRCCPGEAVITVACCCGAPLAARAPGALAATADAGGSVLTQAFSHEPAGSALVPAPDSAPLPASHPDKPPIVLRI